MKTIQNGDEVLRKGPWMPEEDEILVEYVRQFGARDWSSIRSKGLLPRTGKSCRLRWVNKLKPDLKRSGCKFSPEEEKLVVEMQAKLGNKWAKIASCLPGRTDNDVKNFWSTRQKRILRALQRPKMPSGSTDAAADTSDLRKDPSITDYGAFQVHLVSSPFSTQTPKVQHNRRIHFQILARCQFVEGLLPAQRTRYIHNKQTPLKTSSFVLYSSARLPTINKRVL